MGKPQPTYARRDGRGTSPKHQRAGWIRVLAGRGVAELVKRDVSARVRERVLNHLGALDAPGALAFNSVRREHREIDGQILTSPRSGLETHESVFLDVRCAKVVEKIVEHFVWITTWHSAASSR